MRIKLENIGMLENADVKVDGLTVIAGENDTGKSTVGKILFSIIKADNMSKNKGFGSRETLLNKLISLTFENDISEDGQISIQKDQAEVVLKIKDNQIVSFNEIDKDSQNKDFLDATLVQSPIVWDMLNFFSTVDKLKVEKQFYGFDFDVKYPYIFWDLYKKLTTQRIIGKPKKNIANLISETIGGKFKKESQDFYFFKFIKNREIKIQIANTAFGIKGFGILQMLNDNVYITPKGLFIFDEPEVHLHPAWQLKYAEIIVALVEQGIFVIVNSHSPYMVQALKYYSDKIDKVKQITNFYLAEKTDKKTHSVIKDVTNDLNQIFKALAQPLQNIVWA